jgi:hypothetical protein
MVKQYILFLFLSVQLLNQTRNRATPFYFFSATKQKTESLYSIYQTRSGTIPFQNLERSRFVLSDSLTKQHLRDQQIWSPFSVWSLRYRVTAYRSFGQVITNTSWILWAIVQFQSWRSFGVFFCWRLIVQICTS